MKLEKSVRYNLAYAGVLILLAFFKATPRSVGIFVARALAMVFYAAAKKQRKNTIRHLTMAFGDEQMIRKHPEQWVWMHRRWKKQPGDVLKKKFLLSEMPASDIKNLNSMTLS